ncbi:hypothetical protein VFPPC_18249 [Pochonia chlamydosporia 170]|uniref:Uncharacterized protein n=1 Tax=Pochonia chlamydosporia 170 TaxID=1380566 RepID=A0A219AQH3_METCM|nr:hypothetical protein VFPPC_18249 [Pochonia chlamydosporia 170]OWT43030.1 hypothetical protein VFPPC_18249 [Pochonia chlamydosporia 170]
MSAWTTGRANVLFNGQPICLCGHTPKARTEKTSADLRLHDHLFHRSKQEQ